MMNFRKDKTNSKYKNGNFGNKLLNPNFDQYRLNNKQRLFYTELFNENSTNGKVKKENFFPLLGILGTQISHEFSDRMFQVLSLGQSEVTLDQYLKYIDTYFYGDIHERCLYTCKLMDRYQRGKIDFEDFLSYINLIINAVRKVNNTLAKAELMSENDIRYLFNHISNGKSDFTYSEFENIYREKPELVSWFDYFKNDKEDILLIISDNIHIILKELYDFLCGFMNDLFILLDKEKEINMELIFENVLKYNNRLEKIISAFIDKISKFKITSAFIANTDNYQKRKFIYDLQNKIFEENYNQATKNSSEDNKNINEIFSNIKKSLYKKDENEILLNSQEGEQIIPNNRWSRVAENLLKKSRLFGEKNFKFKEMKDLNFFKISQTKRELNANMNKSFASLKKEKRNISIYNSNINTNLINKKINNQKNKSPINIFHRNLSINNGQNYYINNNLNFNINNSNINNNINQYYIDNQNVYNKYNYEPGNKNNKNTFSDDEFHFKGNTFQSLKESQKLKQLLFFSRVVIEKALEVNIIFNNCYKWISENYLSKTINKIKKEEKLRNKKTLKRKNSKINKHRKMVPLKKKIIGTSDKSFEILFNMIMGIQIAVQAIPNFKIKNREDIKKYLTKMIYSIQTVYLGKEKEETYLLQEFGGVIFNNIRISFGINKESFIKSISPQDFITELMISSQTIFEELCSTGSSGSLLYYTRDGEFIVKTISKKEYKFLKKMIGEYYFYMKENPLSFLPKLLGCYTLKRKYKKKITNIYFIVMTNVFATANTIDIRFDLKGSKIGRTALKDKTNASQIFQNGDMALKDLDFDKFNERVYVGSKREIILDQIQKDANFLYRMNSNDYSLLLGIHNVKDFEKCDLLKSMSLKTNDEKREKDSRIYSLFTNTYETESDDITINNTIDKVDKFKILYDFDDFGILSPNHKKIYYFGIIDILTEYGTAKHLEHLFKKIRYCSNDMSCIPPLYYRDRFFNYLNIVFSNEDIQNKENSINQETVNQRYSNNFEKSVTIDTSPMHQIQGEKKQNLMEESYTNLQ